jgi:hypothetical protein
MPGTQMLVFGQAPYLAWLFRPFALLPYAWAYVAWLICSAALYASALALFFPSAGLSQKDKKTGYLLALSAMPFLFETWIGGQVSVLAFFAWAVFFCCLHRRQRFLAGAVLALLLFKPTLVLLPAAMLLCGRRWRMVAGFATGAAAMAALSLGIVGWQGLQVWIATLLFDSRFTNGAVPVSHLAKNVDLNTFLQLLIGATPVTTVLFVLACTAGFVALAAGWWRADGQNASENALWAATLCFTLVLSPYAPIYDFVLVVTAAALVAGSIAARPGARREAFCAWLLLLYMVPWITQSFAQFLHLQLFTLAVAGFGIWTLGLSDSLPHREDLWFFNKILAEPACTLDFNPLKTAQEDGTMPNQTGHQSTGRF